MLLFLHLLYLHYLYLVLLQLKLHHHLNQHQCHKLRLPFLVGDLLEGYYLLLDFRLLLLRHQNHLLHTLEIVQGYSNHHHLLLLR